MKRLLVMAAVACVATAAVAQSDFSTAETRAVTHGYADCVVRNQPKLAAQAILENARSSEILRNYRRLISGECLARQVGSAKMHFTGDLYRYALADALVRRELANQTAPSFESVPRLTHHEAGAEPATVDDSGKPINKQRYDAALKAHQEAVGYTFLSHYGECIVRVDGSRAKALLLTKPDSSDEAARFDALRPALGQCLPEGRTLEFGKVALRGTVAINYYRLAHAARTVTERG